jgi:hypothetical protein
MCRSGHDGAQSGHFPLESVCIYNCLSAANQKLHHNECVISLEMQGILQSIDEAFDHLAALMTP